MPSSVVRRRSSVPVSCSTIRPRIAVVTNDLVATCTKPYSASVLNISAMSFGALSPNAVRSLNAGAKKGGGTIAYYAGAVLVDLLRAEQDRLTAEAAQALQPIAGRFASLLFAVLIFFVLFPRLEGPLRLRAVLLRAEAPRQSSALRPAA